jgi:hypothetical protein
MYEDEENQQFDIHRKYEIDGQIQLFQQWIDHHDEDGENW